MVSLPTHFLDLRAFLSSAQGLYFIQHPHGSLSLLPWVSVFGELSRLPSLCPFNCRTHRVLTLGTPEDAPTE